MKRIIAFALTLAFLFPISAFAATVNNSLCWDRVTTNGDGTPVTNLGGYRIKLGAVTHVYTITKEVVLTPTPLAPCSTLGSLTIPDGTYFAVVTAYNTDGAVSGDSNEVTFILNTKVPAIPGNLRLQ